MLSFVTLLVLGILAGIFLAAFIGANDSANSVGAALGCGLSVYKVIFMAAVFEMIGAIFLGGFVSQTITSKILIMPNTGDEQHQVRELMLVMLSVLIGSGSWLSISTVLSLPVSTTHSVIGSVVGCGVLMGGVAAIEWKELIWISVWWVTSPLVGGVVSFIFWFLLKKVVVSSGNSVSRMLTALPFLSFLTIGILLLFVIYRGLTPFNLHVPIYVAIPVAAALAVFCACFVWKMIIPEIVKQMTKEASRSYRDIYLGKESSTSEIVQSGENGSLELKEETDAQSYESYRSEEMQGFDQQQKQQQQQEQEQFNDEPREKNSTEVTLVVAHDDTPAQETDDIKESLTTTKQEMKEVVASIKVENGDGESDADTAERHVFRFLVVLTSGCIAMAHGANDISNASAPLSVIASSFQTKKLPTADNMNTVLWVTLLTTGLLILGLVTLGYRVMKTIGTRITKMTPARAFVVQLSTATITLTCSLLGIPLSTTHIIVGCIYGINLVDITSIREMKWKLIVGIITSWFVTIPFSALISIAVFAFGRALLG